MPLSSPSTTSSLYWALTNIVGESPLEVLKLVPTKYSEENTVFPPDVVTQATPEHSGSGTYGLKS